MGTITQMNFEFNQWEEVFKTWKENLPIYGDNMQLVISEGEWVSGYWIEPKGTELLKDDHVYIGKQVDELETRVRTEIELAEKEKRSPQFIT